MTSLRTNKWSRQDIRQARRVDLPSLLQHQGFALSKLSDGNFEMRDFPGLIVKNTYWRWPDQNRQGNTIDLFVDVLGKSFAQAMEIISPQ